MTVAQFFATYGVTIVSIVLTIISFVVAYLKARKTGNTKGLVDLLEQIPVLVTTAEQLFGEGHGQAKLDYVLTQLRLYALQHHIKVDEETLKTNVNSVVTTTNLVNTNKPTVEPPTFNNSGASVESEQPVSEDTLTI